MKKQMSNSIAFVKGVEVGIHEVENLYASIQKQRRMEGMIAAKKRGVRFGRPPKPRPKNFEQFKDAWLDGKLSSKKAAKMIGISQDTFLRWARDTSTQEMTVEEALQILGDFRKTLVSNPSVCSDVQDKAQLTEAINTIEQYIVQRKNAAARKNMKSVFQEIAERMAE